MSGKIGETIHVRKPPRYRGFSGEPLGVSAEPRGFALQVEAFPERGNQILTIEDITNECLRVLANNLNFAAGANRQIDRFFRAGA